MEYTKISTNEIPNVPVIREAFRDKKKSNLMLYLMKLTNLSKEDTRKILDFKSIGYIDNKLYRDSYNFDEIIALLYAADMSVCFIDKEGTPVSKIDPGEWLKGYHEDYISNYERLKETCFKDKYEEYLILKEKVAELNNKYGFEEK